MTQGALSSFKSSFQANKKSQLIRNDSQGNKRLTEFFKKKKPATQGDAEVFWKNKLVPTRVVN